MLALDIHLRMMGPEIVVSVVHIPAPSPNVSSQISQGSENCARVCVSPRNYFHLVVPCPVTLLHPKLQTLNMKQAPKLYKGPQRDLNQA